jgi:monofunctional biosynthetic peptidoglycan transglycosylase
MEDRLVVPHEKNPDAKLRHKWIRYDKISLNLKRLVAAVRQLQDPKASIGDAIQRGVRKMKQANCGRGGSTINAAANLFLSSKRSSWRKLEEAIITVMLETVLSKQRIFEIYLNIIEWGNGVFGAEAASRYYFDKSAANLDAWEAARLASMVPNPRYYDRNRSTAFLDKKTNLILGRMPSAEVP